MGRPFLSSLLHVQVCSLDGSEVRVPHTTGIRRRLGYPHLDPKPKLPPHIRPPFKVIRVFFKRQHSTAQLSFPWAGIFCGIMDAYVMR